MPRKPKSATTVQTPLAPIPSEVLEQFVRQGPLTSEELAAVGRRFKMAVIERALGTELSRHLGSPLGVVGREDGATLRASASGMTLPTSHSLPSTEVSRYDGGSLDPERIGKPERRFAGLDDKVVALHARGLTVREIQAFLAEMYAVELPLDLISDLTETVVTEVMSWRTRPLDPMYPVVFFDALRVRIRDESVVRSKAVYVALAILADGTRDILGLWIEQTEGAKSWLKVFADLKARGCQDILIAVTDGLEGMSEALGAVFPATTLQTCIVHLIRHSLDFASWKERKAMGAVLRPIYTAATADAGLAALESFERGPWGPRFPTVAAAWRRSWPHVIPFFVFPPEVRRVIYNANALESVHARLRKVVKTRAPFPSDEAACTLIWLALRDITASRTRAVVHWKTAMNQFAILYEDRFTRADV